MMNAGDSPWIIRALSSLLAAILIGHAMPCRAVEIGMDFGATLQVVDNVKENILSLGAPAPDGLGIFPVQLGRVGVPVSSTGTFETSLGFSLISVEQVGGGRRSLGHLVVGLGYLQSLSTSSQGAAPYIRVGTQARLISATDIATLTQFGLGGGAGIRKRLGSVLGIRFEALATRWFTNDDFRGHWDLSARFGVSAFTH